MIVGGEPALLGTYKPPIRTLVIGGNHEEGQDDTVDEEEENPTPAAGSF